MNSKKTPFTRTEEAGNTLIMALLTLAVLSAVGANVLLSASSRYNYTQKAAGWTEALGAAEAGIDFGFTNCRWTVVDGTPAPWNGWKKYQASSSSWITVNDANDADSELAAGRKIIYDLPAGSHLMSTGEGATDLWYHVEVDAPAALVVSDNRWYRIRSTGYAGLPGMARANNDSPDGARTHNDILRKFDLRIDHFIKRYGDYANPAGTSVAVAPQAARRIEVIARPQTPFMRAVVGMAPSGTPVGIPLADSYDSTDSQNYPGGLYSALPRNLITGVGTNATVYVNAPISSISTSIYGNLETNAGSVTKTDNITGTVANDVVLNLPAVTVPKWAVTATTKAPVVLAAGSIGSPTFQTYSSINNLSVIPPIGQTKGVANLYITGEVRGSITVAAGVTLRIWFAGDFSMKASDINNLNSNAAKLQLYGIDPPSGQSRKFDINSGSPGLRYFTVYAPGYTFTNTGNPDLCGSFVAKTIQGNGNTTWHYDEALATTGIPYDYQRASWIEDPR